MTERLPLPYGSRIKRDAPVGARFDGRELPALEGDTVLKAARDLGHLWRERIVPFSIDNQAFQRSAVKGWSRAERISVLVRSLFAVAVSSGCIFEFSWISTHDNIYADALSRPDPLSSFLALVSAPASQLKERSVLRRASDAGKVKPLEPHFFGQPPAPSSPPSSGEWDAAGSDATLLSPGGSRLGIGTPQGGQGKKEECTELNGKTKGWRTNMLY